MITAIASTVSRKFRALVVIGVVLDLVISFGLVWLGAQTSASAAQASRAVKQSAMTVETQYQACQGSNKIRMSQRELWRALFNTSLAGLPASEKAQGEKQVAVYLKIVDATFAPAPCPKPTAQTRGEAG